MLEIAAKFGINGTDPERYVGIEQRLLLVAKNDVATGATNLHLGDASHGAAELKCGFLVEIQIEANAQVAKQFNHPDFQIRSTAIAPMTVVQRECRPIRSSQISVDEFVMNPLRPHVHKLAVPRLGQKQVIEQLPRCRGANASIALSSKMAP